MGIDGALDDLTAFLAARDDAERHVAPFMRSQVHRGSAGAGAYVLLHGLTASPPAWRSIASTLHASGHTVVVPRLLHHGHTDRMTRALRNLHPAALLEDMRTIVAQVAALGEPVTIVGHSLGATLAISVGLHAPGVTRIVAIAPFLGIVKVPREVHAPLRALMAPLGDVFLWWDPVQRENLMPAHGYPRYPVRALATGIAIADAARAAARVVRSACAIDLVLNDGESSVSNRTARRLARDWRAAGVPVAIHRLTGLGWSHDIIEPDRAPARAAQRVLVQLVEQPHEGVDRAYRIERTAP